MGVKFETPSLAQEAMLKARAQNIPAAMARTSMGNPHESQNQSQTQQLQQQQHAQFQYSIGTMGYYNGLRQELAVQPTVVESEPGRSDTVACIGAVSRGFTEESVKSLFTEIPGCVAYKANTRLGGGFISLR